MSVSLHLCVLLCFFTHSALGKCHFGHEKGVVFHVNQTYHQGNPLEFVYTCDSIKFDPTTPEFFYYRLDFCKAKNRSFVPGNQWRHGAFLYECFFNVSKANGSISEVRHIGCFVGDYLIQKGDQALIGNYRYSCDDLGLHPVSCISSKEALEIAAETTVDYGLDTYICNNSVTGLTLEEKTRGERCRLTGDVALAYLIDTSESITWEMFQQIVKPTLAEEINSLPNDFQIRLLSYSSSFKVHTDWVTVTDKSRPGLVQKAQTLPYLAEGTMTASALKKTARLFQNVISSAKYVILITDGRAYDKEHIPNAVRDLAKVHVKVVSVGVGPGVNVQELAHYGYSVIELQNLSELRAVFQSGKVRCKLYERLRKTLDAKNYCDSWASTDIPMQLQYLPKCPQTVTEAEIGPGNQKDPACTDNPAPEHTNVGWKNCKYNPGAKVCYFSKTAGIQYGGKGGKVFKSRSQCCYDASGALITEPKLGAGAAAKATKLDQHIVHDVQPAEYCMEAGLDSVYNTHRPTYDVVDITAVQLIDDES